MLSRPLLALPLVLAVLAATPASQLDGSVDYTPTLPPNAAWPLLQDVAGTAGAGGTDFADPGVGRGMAWVDVVGRDPSDPGNPNKIGPPDGILDFVHANSNSPALPLGAPMASWITPPIGSSPSPTAVFRGESDGRFTRVTHLMGVTGQGFDIEFPGGSPWGVLPADYDGDGDFDLFFPCGGFNASSPNALLRNDGGVFINVSQSAGITENQVTFGAAWLDYDRDGDLDLYVANSIGFPGPYFQGIAPGDPTDRLYRNNGNGSFTDIAPQAGVDLKSTGFSCSTSDLDNDGWTDLVVSCWGQYNKVFYNNQDGTFSFMAPARHPTVQLDLHAALSTDPHFPAAEEFSAVPSPQFTSSLPMSGQGSMPVEIVDMNGDGWTDVLFGVWSSQLPDANTLGAEGAQYSPAERNYFYLNLGDQDGDGLGDGNFREVGLETGFSHVAGTMGLHAADFNADGYLDLYAGNGGPRVDHQLEEDLFYVNDGPSWPSDFQARPQQPLNKTLFEVGALTGAYGNKFMAHGMISTYSADDGRVGIAVANGGPAVFNQGQTNALFANAGRSDGKPIRTFAIELAPEVSAPAALGTRVELLRGEAQDGVRIGVLERRNSIGFACASTGPLVFGLGQSDPVYARVAWTSGVRQGCLLLGRRERVLTIAEPSISVATRRAANTIELELEQRAAPALAGNLELEVLRLLPVRFASGATGASGASGATGPAGGVASLGSSPASQWLREGRTTLAAGINLMHATAWNFTHPVPAREDGALLRFLLTDPVTGAVLAENALYWDPLQRFAQARRATSAPSIGPRWTSDWRPSPEEPGAQRPVLAVLRGMYFRARAIEVTTYGEIRTEQRALLDSTQVIQLDAGGRIRLGNGIGSYSAPSGSRPASVHFEGDVLVLTTGAPLGCCDEADAGPIQVTRIEGLRGQLLWIDGVSYTAQGRRTSG